MPSHPRHLRHWGLSAAFLTGICLPLLGTGFHWGVSDGSEEKRILASPPQVSSLWLSPPLFYSQLKAYLTDGFGFRAPLVRLNSLVELRLLHSSPSPRLVVGKRGWLFYAGERAMEDYRCSTPFTGAELDDWQRILERRRNWLAARNISYFVVVAPNGQTIYPEFLPSTIWRVRQVSRLDQLLSRLRATSQVNIVDLRAALWRGKDRERMYCLTDTHWTGRGAFVGARELLSAIKAPFPALGVPDRDHFRGTETQGIGGDLATMMGLQGTLRETVLDLQPLSASRVHRRTWYWGDPTQGRHAMVLDCSNPGSPGPSALVFHDSFGIALESFLPEAFARTVFLPRGGDFEPDFVETVHPQVVIQEFVERRLMAEPPTS